MPECALQRSIEPMSPRRDSWEMTFRITRNRSDLTVPAEPPKRAPWPVRALSWAILAMVSGLIGWAIAELLR
jgi:hypothetical protein